MALPPQVIPLSAVALRQSTGVAKAGRLADVEKFLQSINPWCGIVAYSPHSRRKVEEAYRDAT